VYVFVLPFAAVTVYATGLVKFCVAPLFGDMLAPVCVIVGVKAITFVPYGTVTLIVRLASFTIPVTAGLAKLKPVISFAGFAATLTVTV
jgi:hypothetical protein